MSRVQGDITIRSHHCWRDYCSFPPRAGSCITTASPVSTTVLGGAGSPQCMHIPPSVRSIATRTPTGAPDPAPHRRSHTASRHMRLFTRRYRAQHTRRRHLALLSSQAQHRCSTQPGYKRAYTCLPTIANSNRQACKRPPLSLAAVCAAHSTDQLYEPVMATAHGHVSRGAHPPVLAYSTSCHRCRARMQARS